MWVFDCFLVSVLDCQSISPREGRNLVEDFCSTFAQRTHSYDEYTDYTVYQLEFEMEKKISRNRLHTLIYSEATAV